MPNKQEHIRWNPKEMLTAIEEFERSGDDTQCLRLLGMDQGRNPLLVLQDGLRRATSRRERDEFEDIALRCSRGERSTCAATPAPGELMRRATARYGDHAGRFLTVEQIHSLVRGLWRLCIPPPTEECLLAILGIEIENAVKDTVSVEPRSYGETMSLFRVNCQQCGGSKKGRGNIICPACLAKAKAALQVGLASGHLRLRDDVAPDIDVLAPAFLAQNASDFGCANCGHQPIKPCSCAREVRVPASPKDGEIVRGRETASGQGHFFCLRLEGT
jgi:hypothetical protein